MQYLLRCAMLFVGLQCGLWLVRPTRPNRAEEEAAARSSPAAVSRAWAEFRDRSRRGIACQADLAPHPILPAAFLGLIATAVLSTARRRAA